MIRQPLLIVEGAAFDYTLHAQRNTVYLWRPGGNSKDLTGYTRNPAMLTRRSTSWVIT